MRMRRSVVFSVCGLCCDRWTIRNCHAAGISSALMAPCGWSAPCQMAPVTSNCRLIAWCGGDRFSGAEVLELLRQLLPVLTLLHGRGLVHGHLDLSQ